MSIKEIKEVKDPSPVRVFLFKKDKLKFKALCSLEGTDMQKAIEDYVKDCVAQEVLL